MKKQIGWWWAPLLAIALSIMAGTAFAGQDSETAVREAAAGFYSALEVFFTGDLGPMTKVWSHADDVTYMGPDGGFEVGWPQVLEDWKKQAAMKLGGRVEPQEMRVFLGREIAVVQNYEKGVNANTGAESGKVSIRATNIFRKEGGKWKMVSHHTDLLPFLKK